MFKYSFMNSIYLDPSFRWDDTCTIHATIVYDHL